jgi:hypothetical protein
MIKFTDVWDVEKHTKDYTSSAAHYCVGGVPYVLAHAVGIAKNHVLNHPTVFAKSGAEYDIWNAHTVLDVVACASNSSRR